LETVPPPSLLPSKTQTYSLNALRNTLLPIDPVRLASLKGSSIIGFAQVNSTKGLSAMSMQAIERSGVDQNVIAK